MKLLFCFLLCIRCFVGVGQCTIPSYTPNCGGIPVFNNAAIAVATHYSYNGGTNSYTGVSLLGGRLSVCSGNLTLSAGYASGDLYVAPGSVVTLLGNVDVTSTMRLFVYGTLTIAGTLTVNNGGVIYVGTGGVLNVGTTLTDNSSIINLGTINVTSWITNASGTMCMGSGSVLNSTNLQNTNANAISVPSGSACINFSGTATLNQNLTSSSGLRICQTASATGPANPARWGSAIVTTGCLSCGILLPVVHGDLRIVQKEDGLLVELPIYSFLNGEFLILESSEDGDNWSAGNPYYLQADDSSFVQRIADQTSYYRVAIYEKDGDKKYTNIVYHYSSQSVLGIYPNPFHESIHVHMESSFIRILDTRGNFVYQGENTYVDGSAWPNGVYIVQDGAGNTERLVKL